MTLAKYTNKALNRRIVFALKTIFYEIIISFWFTILGTIPVLALPIA
jgi:hypothetical protein